MSRDTGESSNTTINSLSIPLFHLKISTRNSFTNITVPTLISFNQMKRINFESVKAETEKR